MTMRKTRFTLLITALVALIVGLAIGPERIAAQVYNAKNYFSQCSGASPCDNVLNLGGTWKIGSTAVTPTAAVLNSVPSVYVGGSIQTTNKKIAYGQQTTVAASDTVATGLTTVIACVASLESDPGDDPEWTTCAVGDQVGAPAAGSILVKTWKNTTGTDPTPLAATTFSKKVNWVAWGN